MKCHSRTNIPSSNPIFCLYFLQLVETCEATVGDQCDVIVGGVSVTIGDDDTTDEVVAAVLEITEEAMSNDKLLSNDVSDLEKVTFLGAISEDDGEGDDDDGDGDEEDGEDGDEDGDKDGNGGEVGGEGDGEDGDEGDGSGGEGEGGDIVVAVGTDPNQNQKDDIPEGLIVGTSFAALASLLALLVLSKKRKDDNLEKAVVEDESPFGMVEFPGVADTGSYLAADSQDLGKCATCQDVHQCKSQTCPKCYSAQPINFVDAPLNENGQFARENVDAVPTRTFTNESNGASEDSDDDMSQQVSVGSWTTVSFPRLAWW